MTSPLVPIVQLLFQEAPAIIQLIQARHDAANPGVPPPTSEEVIAAFDQVFSDAILKDELIKAALQGGT